MKKKTFNLVFKKRVFLIYFFLIFFVSLIFYKLIKVHVLDYEFYKKKSEGQSIGRIELPAYRGRILDRNGVVLAYSLSSYSIAIRPTAVDVKKLPEIYEFLVKNNIKSNLLKSQKDFINFVLKLREEGVNFYFIKRKFANKVDNINIDGLGDFGNSIEIIKEPSGERYYNFSSLRSIIGTVDIDGKGIEGLELFLEEHDSEIKGKSGYYEFLFDATGKPNYNRVIDFKLPVEGKDIYLSIDVGLQEGIDLLAKEKLKQHKASEVTIVVTNKKGEVLACVSADRSNDSFIIGGINKLYEPGSIFKIFTVVAALEAGLSPKEKFFSGPNIVIDGWLISNADDGLYTSGYETIEDILTYSFNVGTVSLMLRIGKKRFIEYLYKFGFYEYSGIEHPSDVKPLIGDLTNEPNIRFATISFGQGIAISPLHMLKFMTMIANGGYKVDLTFIKDKNVLKEKILSDFTVQETRKYLRSVVERGTGKKAEVEGYYCAGKTGTAQVVSPSGGYLPGKYIASFVGFFPYFDPEYVIIVSVKEPVGMYYGGQVAAPIFKDVVSLLISRYNIKPNIKDKS